MKIKNICTARTYEKNGETKKAWNTVGRLVEFDATPDRAAQQTVELFMFPGTKFYVFEEKKKDEKPVQTQESAPAGGEDVPY